MDLQLSYYKVLWGLLHDSTIIYPTSFSIVTFNNDINLIKYVFILKLSVFCN